MLHKRYNYKRPLLLVVIFLVIFLKTNTISQSNTGSGHSQSASNIAFVPKVYTGETLENNYRKKSVLLNIYNRFISQFL